MMENQYIDLYEQLLPLLREGSATEMNEAREEAMALFRAHGLPTRKDERYRYTDVAKAFRPDYGVALTPIDIKGVQYAYAFKDAPQQARRYYNSVVDSAVNRAAQPSDMRDLKGEYYPDPLTALNTALAYDALVIYLPRGTKAAAPIRIENILKGEQDQMAIRRVLIVMEEQSEATIFLVDHAKTEHQFLSLQVIEVVVNDGARLDMYELEETSSHCNRFSNLYLRAGRCAEVRHNNITMTNGVTRNGIDVYLQGEGASVVMNGAVIADGTESVDNNTLIDHQVKGCSSTELYKYVIDDEARGAFAGKIMVREGADQTASQETNNNMVAATNARMFTQPMLEIYADDVKCAHGSTVGVMDDKALFFMQQRGIPLEVAKTLLKTAFISQVVDEMRWPYLRDRLHILVDKRLSKEERCGTCRICK